MAIQKSHLFSLAIASLMACAIPTFAQQVGPLILEDEAIAETEVEQVDNRYRIGIDCVSAPKPLRVHLGLHEDSGLLVNHVMSGSPADRAGIKRYDIIVEADGQPVASALDLSRAVNKGKGSEINVAVIQEGKEKLLKITPEERDEDEIQRLRNGFANRLGRGAWPPGMMGGLDAEMDEIQKQVEKVLGNMPGIPGMPGRQFGFRRINPGIVLDQSPIPNGNLSMHIEQKDGGPAKIKIERGNEKWEVTQNELDQLPDDIRPMVENMLNGNRLNFHGLMAPRPPQPRIPAQPRRAIRKSDDRIDGLELKLEELKEAIQNIQGDQ